MIRGGRGERWARSGAQRSAQCEAAERSSQQKQSAVITTDFDSKYSRNDTILIPASRDNYAADLFPNSLYFRANVRIRNSKHYFLGKKQKSLLYARRPVCLDASTPVPGLIYYFYYTIAVSQGVKPRSFDIGLTPSNEKKQASCVCVLRCWLVKRFPNGSIFLRVFFSSSV